VAGAGIKKTGYCQELQQEQQRHQQIEVGINRRMFYKQSFSQVAAAAAN
jgi:hypothetical protein